MALQGEPKDTEWLNNPELRQFNGHEDIRKALKMGWLVTDIVQAINRIRCRKVTDSLGNCPEANAYIMFQNDAEADEILRAIKKEMPGITILEDWEIDTRKKKPKKSRHQQSLCKYLETMTTGKLSKSEMADIIGASQSTINRLLGEAQEDGTMVQKALEGNGVELVKDKAGRVYKTYFMKN